MRILIASAVFAFASVAAAQAEAATVTVTVPDSAGFQLIGSGDAAVTYDGVTFSQSSALSNGNFFNVGTGFSGSPPVLSSQEQSAGVPNILITLPSLASSLSIVYGAFNADTITFQFSNGTTLSGSTTGSSYSTPDVFNSGIMSPFMSVQLLDSNTGGVFNISSITYTTSDVPEPASWAMFTGGFGLIGGAMRSRKKVAFTFA